MWYALKLFFLIWIHFKEFGFIKTSNAYSGNDESFPFNQWNDPLL